MSSIKAWLAERLPVKGEQLRELTNEPVPNHMKRWWFCLGGTPAYLFIVQIVTGILLAFYFQPAPEQAWESVRYITEEAAYGWYLRSVHKWAATLMIATIILHQIRVYFTGGYRRPRELNWMIGMTLLLCTLVEGFTGYSLVFEQLSYWGATVGANIMDSVPLIGGVMKQFVLGGETYNRHTLPRFFVLHAAVLPATMIMLLGIHVALIRMHGISELRFEGETEAEKKKTFDFFPDHVYTEIIMGLVIMVVLSFLATILPAHLGARADPLVTPEVIKPEWWFYVSFRWLKLFSGTLAVLSMGLIVFLMYMWPLMNGWIRRRWPGSEFSVWLGIAATFGLIGLTLWEAIAAH